MCVKSLCNKFFKNEENRWILPKGCFFLQKKFFQTPVLFRKASWLWPLLQKYADSYFQETSRTIKRFAEIQALLLQHYLRIHIMHKDMDRPYKKATTPYGFLYSFEYQRGTQSMIESFHGTSLNRWTHHFLIQNTMECDEGPWNGWIRRILFQRATDPLPCFWVCYSKSLAIQWSFPMYGKYLGNAWKCLKHIRSFYDWMGHGQNPIQKSQMIVLQLHQSRIIVAKGTYYWTHIKNIHRGMRKTPSDRSKLGTFSVVGSN